ncbi:MAG: hypothetical protein ABL986_22785 [Vicinamibacterales bacterium]
MPGRGWLLVVMTMLLMTGSARSASGQISALVSPGRLSQAHTSLEGVTSCLKCHTASRGVTADKCLSCHKPVADRIAQKRGVHKNVTTDCISCHVEHAGVNAELRPFDQKAFNHTTQTTFPLDGLHAPIATSCAACHKSRSFLTLSNTCASCHTDSHKGSLGPKCETCHTTTVKFADTRKGFDHSRTAYPLAGAHTRVTCTSCHVNNTYKGVKFGECSSCHTDPHRTSLGPSCSSCHTVDAWRTRKIDHTRTAFPLKGLHADVECASCHKQPAMKVVPKSDTCATCHTDPHKGTFKQDCKSCHSENGFKQGATFDHSTTRFPLADGHANLTCVQCHKPAAPTPAPRLALRSTVTQTQTLGQTQTPTPTDFRGLSTTCASCHADVHKGDLGTTCESCHNSKTFRLPGYTHAAPKDFFLGLHTPLRCEQCHVSTFSAVSTSPAVAPPRVGFPTTPTSCASCHKDIHLGQVDSRCETCHGLTQPRFAISGFSHDRTTYPLTGKHVALECRACHKADTAAFPAGTGTAVRLRPIGTTCVTCHQDPHKNELGDTCQTCHTTQTFTVASPYTHRNARALRSFFTGRHNAAACVDCHKPLAPAPASAVAARPAARPAAPAAATVRPAPAKVQLAYRISTTCVSCHRDIHRGSLGPNCESCHKP